MIASTSRETSPFATLIALLLLLPACGNVTNESDARARLDATNTDATNTDTRVIDGASPDVARVDAGGDTTSACRLAPVVLGTAANFAVLAGPTVTNTGLTSVVGDLGVSPGTAVTGFPPGAIVGSQHAGDPTAALAMADLKKASDDAAARTLCPIPVAGNLGGKTLLPGLYTSATSLEISSGDLTLDARGDAAAVFIFQMTTTLTTTTGRQVALAGGARAANVFWQVGSSATLGSMSVLQGTILATQSVTANTGAKVTGRLLARIAAVSLDTNIIVRPAP